MRMIAFSTIARSFGVSRSRISWRCSHWSGVGVGGAFRGLPVGAEGAIGSAVPAELGVLVPVLVVVAVAVAAAVCVEATFVAAGVLGAIG